MAKDYYELLGVSKGASADEIKKSYRKAALKYHPDRNPDDAAAESNFKEVSQAYEVLGDTEKRQMYDRVGHDAYVNRASTGGGGGYGNASERDPEAVEKDVRLGYVSRDAAERDYGVALNEAGQVDAAATQVLRVAARP